GLKLDIVTLHYYFFCSITIHFFCILISGRGIYMKLKTKLLSLFLLDTYRFFRWCIAFQFKYSSHIQISRNVSYETLFMSKTSENVAGKTYIFLIVDSNTKTFVDMKSISKAQPHSRLFFTKIVDVDFFTI